MVEPPSVAQFRPRVGRALRSLGGMVLTVVLVQGLDRLHAASPAGWSAVGAVLIAAFGVVTIGRVRAARRADVSWWRSQVGVELLVAWTALLACLAWGR